MTDRDGERVEFCEREYPRLVGMLVLYIGDAELAAELAQETLVRVCVHWRNVRCMDAPGAWAHRVALNLARSSFRRKHIERRVRPRLDPEPRFSEQPEDVGEALEIRALVMQLPTRQRLAVLLRYFSDMSVEDAAVAMRCRPGTVKALTHQGVKRLRSQLSQSKEIECES